MSKKDINNQQMAHELAEEKNYRDKPVHSNRVSKINVGSSGINNLTEVEELQERTAKRVQSLSAVKTNHMTFVLKIVLGIVGAAAILLLIESGII